MTRVREWTIYVCSECGQPGTKFVSEHSIPLRCDPYGEQSHEHAGRPEAVIVREVEPARNTKVEVGS